MDNKPLETQAESLIQYNLIKYGLLVTKPFFDKEGTDLLIVKDISNKTTPFIKVQCKGRTIKTSSNITIPKSYVEDNFVVFLYVKEDKTKEDFLYVFFQEEIKKWESKGDNFQLLVPNNFRNKDYFNEQKFAEKTIFKIENILLNQAVKQKLTKTNYSIVIDGIFLEQAVIQTKSIYRKIYPEKIIKKPSIDDILEQLSKYASIEHKEEINCYLICSDHFSLEFSVDIDNEEKYDLLTGEISNIGSKYNLFKLRTQDLVFLQVEKHIERIINTENVFLVADDFVYVPYLQQLEDREMEIIVFQNSENAGTRMYHKFNWAKITYPLALAMGLDQHEL